MIHLHAHVCEVCGRWVEWVGRVRDRTGCRCGASLPLLEIARRELQIRRAQRATHAMAVDMMRSHYRGDGDFEGGGEESEPV